MKNSRTIFLSVIACISLSVLVVCAEKAGSISKSRLHGEVYLSDYRQLDFEIEISAITETKKNKDKDKEEVFSNSGYDNRVYSWGLKRNTGNNPPAADPGARELLEKFNGIYIGDVNKKRIYLTFDEGYENGYTPQILDTLKRNGVKAVFFITGPYLKEHEDLVRRMVEEGHTVGNHTVRHPSLPTMENRQIEEEVLGLDRVFYEKFGKHMKYLRPPKGEYSERTLKVTNQLGYINLFWSFAYDDWYRDKHRGADYAYEIVTKNLHNGAVILLHAVSRDNAKALDRIIKGAREKGYKFGEIEELGWDHY